MLFAGLLVFIAWFVCLCVCVCLFVNVCVYWLACLPVCLSACLLACLPACLLACLLACFAQNSRVLPLYLLASVRRSLSRLVDVSLCCLLVADFASWRWNVDSLVLKNCVRYLTFLDILTARASPPPISWEQSFSHSLSLIVLVV